MDSLFRCFVLILVVGLVAGHNLGEPENVHCTAEGRIADPFDCGSFIDCIPDGTGRLLPRRGSCHGQAYDPAQKRCTKLDKVVGCKPRKGRDLASDPSLAYVCVENDMEFVCADCKTLVNCVNKTAYPEPCGHGDFCAFKEKDFGGGVCYPNEPKNCTCDEPNSFKQDPYQEERFLFCEKVDSDPVIYQCPEDHEFDTETKQCVSIQGLPECEKIGVFADSSNCTRYYTCIFATSGWVQKPFMCPGKFMFNEGTNDCEDPCKWNNGKFACTEEGRFVDPLSCHQYYECTVDISGEGFRKTLHECPEEYVWDPNARDGFGHCVLEETKKETCNPYMPEKCIIPPGYCSPSDDVAPVPPNDDPSDDGGEESTTAAASVA